MMNSKKVNEALVSRDVDFSIRDQLSQVRVATVTSGHPPLDDRIFFKQACSLSAAGADVTLFHSSQKESSPPREGVSFRPYAGGGSLCRRLVTSARLREALLRAGPFDIVICHEPDVLRSVSKIKKRLSARVIYDSHEKWGAVLAGRLPKLLWSASQAIFDSFEIQLIAKCDGAIGASWDISDYLASVLGKDRVATVLNAPATRVFPVEDQSKMASSSMIFCHDGTLNFGRGLRTIVEALLFARKEADVSLKIVGDVFGKEKEWLEDFIDQFQLQRAITRTGWLPYEEVGSQLSPCHVGLIALQYTPNNVVTSSNKMFNYLLYGMPFIGPDFRNSVRRIVSEDECGLMADSSSPKDYASKMLYFAQNPMRYEEMSRRALRASQVKYRWEHMEKVLIDLIRRVLN